MREQGLLPPSEGGRRAGLPMPCLVVSVLPFLHASTSLPTPSLPVVPTCVLRSLAKVCRCGAFRQSGGRHSRQREGRGSRAEQSNRAKGHWTHNSTQGTTEAVFVSCKLQVHAREVSVVRESAASGQASAGAACKRSPTEARSGCSLACLHHCSIRNDSIRGSLSRPLVSSVASSPALASPLLGRILLSPPLVKGRPFCHGSRS
jgi:hypothetical protein